MTRVLVAGVGNIFLGDDAFGVEVAQQLRARSWPEGVRVADFGVRALDLREALARCEAAILIDAASRGGAPGTLYVVEPEPARGDADGSAHAVTPHALTPDRVLASLAPEERPRVVRVVGCEPGSFDTEEGLSAPVRAAIEPAARLVEELVRELLRELDARIQGDHREDRARA